jgi:ribosome-associated protein
MILAGMARKLKKGYFVSGQFVAEGSELDLELKRELKGGDAPSRTELKRESTGLQELGTELLGLGPDIAERLALPDKLREALADARRITNFEGKRRQMQYIGKLMRQLDAPEVERIRSALADQRRGPASETLALHQTEQWRERLIADDAAFTDWIAQYPATDTQQLRALIRQSRKDAVPPKAGETPRHGKAYRELFQLVREQMTAIPDNDDPLRNDVRSSSLT